jgi:hypothetical protein
MSMAEQRVGIKASVCEGQAEKKRGIKDCTVRRAGLYRNEVLEDPVRRLKRGIMAVSEGQG